MRRNLFTAGLLARSLFLLGVSLATLSAAPTEARAQDEEALTAARGKFQRALELKQARNYGGALKLFREVGQIKMTPQVRYHIASCEEKLGQLVAALGGYELALAQSDGMQPDFIAEVQTSVDDLRGRIPKLVIERGEGAEAAAVELDGVALGDSSIGQETPLNPGPHTVTATAPGYEPYHQTVNVSEGSLETLSITLTPLPEGSKEPTPGGGAEDDGPHFGKLPFIVGGAGIGVAVIGGVFLGLSQSKVAKLKSDDYCGSDLDCSDLEGADRAEAEKLNKGAHSMETVGWIGVGVGVAALATGTVLLFLDKGAPEEAEVQVGMSFRPSALGADAGFSFVGTF